MAGFRRHDLPRDAARGVDLCDPKLFREYAEEARATAETMSDAGACATVLRVADQYEDLATLAELMRSLKARRLSRGTQRVKV